MPNLTKDAPLASHSTMRLGGNAAYLADITDMQDIPQLIASATVQGMPAIMIGDGSNIVWADQGYPGLVLVNRIAGFELQELDETTAYITIGGGENWDSVVARTVSLGYSGIAELSLIPGTTGATPVQNVGAYGREISETLMTVQAYDTKEQRFVSLQAEDCNFGYRTSRFKTTDRGRFMITSITLMLRRAKPTPPYYDAVATYFSKHHITDPGVQDIRDAVIAIRSAKLPDPKIVANNGSFFANPIIDGEQLTQLLADNPMIKYWRNDDDSIKLSAAWLIEQAGFKDVHDQETGMATWPKQPLVLVNESAKSTADLLTFKAKIVDAVQAKFGVTLQQEPELIG
jgi:UDP-N-acetylmuramate dehydrogenase